MDTFLNKPRLDENCEGEIRDFILELIRRNWNSLPPGEESRGREICQALLACNRETGKRAEIRDKISEILKTWSGQPSQIAALERHGFTVTQGKKHYKLRWKKTGCFVTLPSTPSDRRGGANSVSDMLKKFF